MTRDEALAPVVTAVRAGTSISGPSIFEFFKDWEVVPVELGDQHVGTLVCKGTEVHFALVPGWRPAGSHRGAIREYLRPLFERQGFLTTRVPHYRPAQKQFVQRLGFKPTWRDDGVEYFLLGHLPFERKQ